MTEARGPSGPGFWAAAVVGWAIIAVGVSGLVGRLGTGGALDVGLWVVGGNVIHDVALVPLVGAVAIAVALVVHPPWRAPVLAGLATSAVVVLVSVPLVGRFGAKPRNPTVLPLDYPSAVATVLAVVWTGVAIWCATIAWRRSGRGARSR